MQPGEDESQGDTGGSLELHSPVLLTTLNCNYFSTLSSPDLLHVTLSPQGCSQMLFCHQEVHVTSKALAQIDPASHVVSEAEFFSFR